MVVGGGSGGRGATEAGWGGRGGEGKRCVKVGWRKKREDKVERDKFDLDPLFYLRAKK
jgi:hypothetical protein